MDHWDLGNSLPIKLNPVNRPKGHNTYCGPAAISIVTGAPTSEVSKVMRRGRPTHRRHQAVFGTDWRDLNYALKAYGLRLKTIDRYQRNFSRRPRPTLARWLRENKELRTAGTVFIIDAGDHWQVVSGRRYCCGVVGKIVSIRDSRVKRRARVTEVFQVIREGKISLADEFRETAQEKETKKLKQRMYREWSKLKKQQDEFDFSVDDECETWHFCWIDPGASWVFDPNEDNHHCDTIEDGLWAAKLYIEEYPNRETGKWSWQQD